MATREVALPELSRKYKWQWDTTTDLEGAKFRLHIYRLYHLRPTKIAIGRKIITGDWFSIPAAGTEEDQTAIIHMNCDILRLQAGA